MNYESIRPMIAEKSRAEELEDQLIADIMQFEHDPLAYVLYAYPWAEIGTILENESGPRLWQVQLCNDVRDQLTTQTAKEPSQWEPIQCAVSSGHGIGKSAEVSFLVMWAMSTKALTRVVVMANTENQLRTKTWPEIGKWHALAINSHWFEWTATSLYHKSKHAPNWRADAATWSATNTEAVAGLHNKGNRILLVFDEASAIADKVWEVAEGALTDEGTEILWFAFGNPTRNSGRFRECFGRNAHRWTHSQVDSRTVPGTNKVQIQKWIDDYGEDSDFVRVRVRGQFPRAGSMQLISGEIVTDAMRREAQCLITDPLIMAIDVARFGDDESSIKFRRGKDARTIPSYQFRGLDTMTLSAKAAELIERNKPDAVFVDETGIGGAVVDRLRQLGYQVVGVNNGGKSTWPVDGHRTANKGAEMWVRGKVWMESGGAIENDSDLEQQLTGREYGYNTDSEYVLERKDDMKSRGLSSPDRADALFLTFANPVAAKLSHDLEGRMARAQAREPFRPSMATYNPHRRR